MRLSHRTLVIALSVFVAGTAAAASPAVTGLGQAWPNADDVSASPHFHVYAFQKQGVRYLQINDANGTVRGAVALIGNDALDLPVGVDANRWVIAGAPSTPPEGEVVYQDPATTVSAAPQGDGTVRLMLAPTDCQAHPENCSNKGP